jgi:predicted transcriptional regulator
MRVANIRRLPVMKDGALVGVITSKDLAEKRIRYFCRAANAEFK